MKRDAGDLTGQAFGRLKVIGLWSNNHGNKLWHCKCNCGGEAYKSTGHLRANGGSCGCAQRESGRDHWPLAVAATTKFSHPLKSKIKNLYGNMVKRCTDPEDRRWKDYGGRGIKVCPQWLNNRYEFYQWCVVNAIEQHLQIDRKDNNGPYSPENCKFSTTIEQANNTRRNRLVTHGGRTLTAAQWSRETGLPASTIIKRLNRGLTGKEVLVI